MGLWEDLGFTLDEQFYCEAKSRRMRGVKAHYQSNPWLYDQLLSAGLLTEGEKDNLRNGRMSQFTLERLDELLQLIESGF